ncbi:MAG: hypothetical protein ACLFP8_01880 [Alphaproteobacteria bacterium]
MLKRIAVSVYMLLVSATTVLAGEGASGHHEDASHATGASGLPQLDTSTYIGQIFWLTIVFSVMYAFFSRKTVPEISRTLENRTDRITSDLDSAERLKNEVAELQSSYEEKLTQAHTRAYSALLDAEKEMKEHAEKRADEFQQRALKKVEELELKIEEELELAKKDMDKVAAEIAIIATEKIIGVKATAKSAKAVVDSLADKT